MNNEEARRILSLYRPNGADAADPYFEEALRQARRDPELARWFDEERRLDRRISDALQGIQAPPNAREDLLAAGRLESRSHRFPQWMGGLAAAILLAAGLFFAWLMFDGGGRDGATVADRENVGAFMEMAASAMPFGYRADSVAELSAWLDERGAPVPGVLPESLQTTGSIGCQVFQDPQGNEISLLCLVLNGEFVHLFVMRDESEFVRDWPRGTWKEQEGWSAYSWSDDGLGYVLLSRAPRSELEPLLKEV